ncbi:peptidase M20 domain-containing protein 2-like [Anneissia japonica]|uniref:peptidase M20 domain-containing protein 2-like n=1 Tax=Anneissia japonica TaxID=1529436 RepID=UPI001425B1F3|nr:peptidase M20 domain-containing protein 2-like [Anneissia japonica]
MEVIDTQKVELKQISNEIWKNPELGYEEKYAHKVITDFLEKNGFYVEESYLHPTGFRATYGTTTVDGLEGGEKEGAHACVMVEYDALPEIGHASGRNLVTEAGLAAGIAIKSLIEQGKIKGKVSVLGCPDHEGNGGKVDAIKKHFFEDVDFAVSAQPYTLDICKPVMLTIMRLCVKYKGKQAHASAHPWEGRNALDAAVLCYNNISALRQQLKPLMQVHGIITKGGVKPNIIPSETVMEFYLRAKDHVDMAVLQQRANASFVAAAKATGCEIEFDFHEKPYSNLCSNATLAHLYKKNAEKLGIVFTQDCEELQIPVGSTDVGNVSHVIPTLLPMFSIGTSAMNHTESFTEAAGTDLAHDCALRVGKALAATVIDIMTDKTSLNQMKEDYSEVNCASMTAWH